MYEPLPTFVLRAPLLREADWPRGGEALAAHALGATALALASGRVATATDSAARRRALDRYGRRAAFRATPSGLLAGVCLGTLAENTRVATGAPTAWLAPTWRRMAALGRALLDDEELRRRVRLRAAPSVVRAATTVRWLAPAEPFAEERVAELDARLIAILDATSRWTPWAKARRAARGADALGIDELLLLLVDDGLLRTDLVPPLVGPPPVVWLSDRLTRLGRTALADELTRAAVALARGELERGAAALAALPGADGAAERADVHGVLVHRPRRAPTLARAAVARAAALAPLLFRLQDALAPPASERLAQPALDEALEAATEIHGAGAFDLGALAVGDYGVSARAVDGDDGAERAAAPAVAPAVLALVVDALLAAARAGRAEATLDVATLTDALDGVGPAPPPTCELFLTPMIERGPARAPAGAGWLLGLHAPAGSSWGRFAAALGEPLSDALDALATAEHAARPELETLDVSFAPSAALADLCAHPRVRRRALALSEWPAAEPTAPDDALAPRDLELVADPGAAVPLALRARGDGAPVMPSPLTRVRSTTAPAGTTRLLCGWSLFRQHAPWALALGPLAALERVPRVVMDGFVIAPASWRLPEAPRAAAARRTRLGRWRRAAGVPRFVQVGDEDQLLVVDLDGASAAADLAGHARVWEIWPPLGASVDADGRRLEAVVALVERPDPEDAAADARAARATRAAGRVAPPRARPAPSEWRTFKVFGAPEHQDALLLDALHPAVAAALRAREIRAWFFQRYVDGPGRRDHLRIRARATTPRARAAFAERLEAALAPARAAGAVVTVESGEFHPDSARFGTALAAAHLIFQSDSDLSCALLAEESDADADAPDRLEQVVRSLDALARGLGLDLEERHALARARRDAEDRHGGTDAEIRADTDAEFRVRARPLRALLGAPRAGGAARERVSGAARQHAGGVARSLDAHAKRVARATEALPAAARAALAPALLHLACVRLAGPDRDLERRAYTFWERTLEGLRASLGPRARASTRRA